MTDYQGNAHKSKDGETTKKPEKNVEKVVTGVVIVQKKSLGRRFKDVFVKADLKNVTWYVITDVLIPAAQNMFVDGVTRGVERLAYGDRAIRQRNYGPGPRITYNSPVTRRYAVDRPSLMGGRAPMPERGPRAQPPRYGREDLILASREEAELVLERMADIVDKYDVASVGDLHELVGLEYSHVDNKWGWIDLSGVVVRHIPEGWLIDFPPAEPIS